MIPVDLTVESGDCGTSKASEMVLDCFSGVIPRGGKLDLVERSRYALDLLLCHASLLCSRGRLSYSGTPLLSSNEVLLPATWGRPLLGLQSRWKQDIQQRWALRSIGFTQAHTATAWQMLNRLGQATTTVSTRRSHPPQNPSLSSLKFTAPIIQVGW
jgi:hypothetical protein